MAFLVGPQVSPRMPASIVNQQPPAGVIRESFLPRNTNFKFRVHGR